jgi:hypothetical protein
LLIYHITEKEEKHIVRGTDDSGDSMLDEGDILEADV